MVGSGPCGAVVAKELAEAGRSVVLLEEGPPFTPDDFELDGALSMARTMREGGPARDARPRDADHAGDLRSAAARS